MRYVSPSLTVAVLALGALAACEPPPPQDTQPPHLIDARVSAERELALVFDEPVAEAVTGGDFAPAAPSTVAGDRVTVPLPTTLQPGHGYRWSAEVEDARHNLTSVEGRFYGPNDHPARLRLNEVRVAGSGPHTDLVELRVEAAGSLGGWTLDAYSSPDSRQRIVLPDRAVVAGDLVVIHYRPTGDPAEQDETLASDTSGGSDVDPAAWDFWQPEGKGLSAVKGVLALRPSPTGEAADALVYSRRPGEGAPLAAAVGWNQSEELDPSACTATRTWSRTDDYPARWIVTANGGATPGKPNRLSPWTGPPSSRSAAPKSKGRPTPGRPSPRSARQACLGSKSTREAAVDARPPHRSRVSRGRGRTGKTQEILGRRAPRGPAPPPPTARSRGAEVPWAPGPEHRRRGGEEEPPHPASPSGRPRFPGIGPAEGRRRAEPTPSV